MARQERKYHYIYKITCKITNRYYIGMHSTDNLNDGYFGSGKRLWFSINYHGKENHTKEILEYCDSRENLSKREEEIVTYELINEDLCMNLIIGGQGGAGGFKSDEHEINFHKGTSKWLREQWKDKDYRKKNLSLLREAGKIAVSSGSLNGRQNFKNKTHSIETKKLLSTLKQGTGVGKTNSQYGTCWITKDGLNKKIKKEEINEYIKQGWIQGRK